MGRALNAHKIWGRSYAWFRLWVDLAQIRGLFVGVDRGRYAHLMSPWMKSTVSQYILAYEDPALPDGILNPRR